MTTWLRGTLSMLLAVAILAVALPVAFGSVGGGRGGDDPLRVFSSGSLAAPQVGGATDLSVAGMVPGRSRSATVRVVNPDGGSVALDLAAQLADHRAPAGGSLADALVLRIESSGGNVVYDGPIGRVPALHLGEMTAGGARAYRFTVSLPAAVGNEIEGASLGARFVWSAA